MIRIQCPCCGYYTHEVEDANDLLVDICDVCHWQYDLVAHDYANTVIGPNKVSLNQASENFKAFGAKTERFINYVRKPLPEELPENNQ